MYKPVIVYDDSYKAREDVKQIIGDKSFSEIIHKKHSLKQRYLRKIKENIPAFDYCELNTTEDLQDFIQTLKSYQESNVFIHIYSNYIIKDDEAFHVLMNKHKYIKQNYYVKDTHYALLMFSDYEDYMGFISYCLHKKTTQILPSSIDISAMDSHALYDISTVSRFIKFHANNFESRFFNSVKSDAFTVLKSSTNKKKIYQEYKFYDLLPEQMKPWFVMPYNYKENDTYASYEMERLHMVDIAIRWIHQAIDTNEFKHILNKTFRFIHQRSKINTDPNHYYKIENVLYLQKLDERIKQLKQVKFYKKIDHYIQNGTPYASIDAIIHKYKSLYHQISKVKSKDTYLVVSHGDLCFSNMLYHQQVDMLKLIDPKGATEEEELWTNPYYDIAKLSHSICGLYDFINNGLFDIQLDEHLHLELIIRQDMDIYKRIFKDYLIQNNYNYTLIRIYEASLFLSMLPLHAENEKKVVGFLLNAMTIIKEVEECLKN